MQNDLPKGNERGRALIYMEYDYHSVFRLNPNFSFQKAYYLSNSSLQSQAHKRSCSHSLRLYMFRCWNTGLDNSHQCLKTKRTWKGLTTMKYQSPQGTNNIECFHMTSRCPKTMKRPPCWCPKPILWELNSFLMQTLSFVSVNLYRCWPREWKHSIPGSHFQTGKETSYL